MRLASRLAAVCLVVTFESTASAQQFVYVAHRTLGVIAHNLNLLGGLTPIPGSPFPAGNGPATTAVDPFGRFVFVGNDVSMDVSAYAINPFSGALTTIAGSPFPLGAIPLRMAVDPTGRFLYVVESAAISAFAIDPLSGALTPVPGSPTPVGSSLFGCAIDPFARFLYVANTVERVVISFSIDFLSGALTRIGAAPTPSVTPFDLAADRSGRFVYALGGTPSFFTQSVVQQFSVNGFTGELSAAGETAAGFYPVSMAMDGTGRFIYAAQGLVPTMSGFAINPFTGGLGPIGTFGGSGYLTGDPTGRFLLVSGPGLLVYAINGVTGSLFPTAFAIGGTPQSRPAVTGISWLALFVPH